MFLFLLTPWTLPADWGGKKMRTWWGMMLNEFPTRYWDVPLLNLWTREKLYSHTILLESVTPLECFLLWWESSYMCSLKFSSWHMRLICTLLLSKLQICTVVAQQQQQHWAVTSEPNKTTTPCVIKAFKIQSNQHINNIIWWCKCSAVL